MRTIVDIPERERGALDALARKRGMSRAELVRRAISLFLKMEQTSSTEAFGIWKDRSEDGLDYQDRVRGEWQEQE